MTTRQYQTNLSEFVGEYMQMCAEIDGEEGNFTNREIAEAYLEREPFTRGMDAEDFKAEVDKLLPQLPYYTGKDL